MVGLQIYGAFQSPDPMAALLEPTRLSFLMVAMLSTVLAHLGSAHTMVVAGLAMLLPSGIDFLFVTGLGQFVGALNVFYLGVAIWLGFSNVTLGTASSYQEQP